MKKVLQKLNGRVTIAYRTLILFSLFYFGAGNCFAVISYSSTNSQSSNSATVIQGTAKNDIIQITVVTTGSGGTGPAVTNFTFDASGTTAMGDITAAKVYCNSTLTTAAFATAATLYGTGTISGNTITVTGSVNLLSGTNYFWLTYDISATAGKCNTVTADLSSVIVGGATKTNGIDFWPASTGYRTIDGAMSYSSGTTTQNNTNAVIAGSTNNEVIGIHLVTPGSISPFNATSFTFNTTGTTNAGDITNAKVWYTGASSTFSTATQFGSAVASPSGAFTITGSQTLSGCNNYFWLTYDVLSGATPTHVIDAECTSLIVGGTTYTPSITAPPGNRQIVGPQGNFTVALNQGNSGKDEGLAISVDGSGNSYVTGYFSGTVTFGITTLTSAGSYDIFIIKYDPSGNIVWAKSAGGNNTDYGYGISIDGSGNSYVSGAFFSGSSANFSGTTLAGAGSFDIFIAKYNSAGTLQWVKSAGSTLSDYGNAIKTDGSGNSYVTGYFNGTAVFASTTLTSAGSDDIFIAKYDANGVLLWVKQEGGASSNDDGNGISIDNSGNSYVTGVYSGNTTFFGSPNISLTTAGGYDIFVAKFDPSGNALWAKGSGGIGTDFGYGISTDGTSGASYVTGYFSNTAVFSGVSLSSSGASDMFVAKYDASGNLGWVKQADGANSRGGQAITIDASDNSYVTGYIGNATTFFGSPNLTATPSGIQDVFVAKYDASGNVLCVQTAGGPGGNDVGMGVGIDGTGNAYVTGYFTNNATFPGSPNITISSNASSYDMFLSKWVPCAAAVLPIEMLSLKVKNTGESNILEWTTTSQINNDFFVIERKSEGENGWEKTGKVKGARNNNSTSSYQFTDSHFSPSNSHILYYRLQQVDFDGSFTYSNIVSVTIEQSSSLAISAYPNPAKENLQLTISNWQSANKEIGVSIYDVVGREISKSKFLMLNYSFLIDISSLSKGIYFLQLKNGTDQTQTKFVKE